MNPMEPIIDVSASSDLPYEGVEHQIAQQVQMLYSSDLGHQPGVITCQPFDGKLAIFIENAITQPEQLLIQSGYRELAQQVRSHLNAILEPKIKTLVESTLNVQVNDILTAVQVDTRRLSIIAILTPQ